MESHKLLAALVPLALLGNAPRVAAETVPYWVTDTSAYVLVFTGAPNPQPITQSGDVESHVDALFGSADATADAGYASVFSKAEGSPGPTLFYNTHSSARADAELNGLAVGNYRVSFAYTVLSSGPGILTSNDAAVGYQFGNMTVELAGTNSGVYSADIFLNDGAGANDNWIGFFAWTDSHGLQGTGSGTAVLTDAEVIRLPDTPVLPTPLPGTALLLVPALGLLAGVRRRRGAIG